MLFQEFCEAVLTAAIDAYGKEASPVLRTVLKNNDVERKALFIQGNTTTCSCSPLVYLEPYYRKLLWGTPMDSLLKDIFHCISDDYTPVHLRQFIEQLTDPRPHLRIRLIQFEKNQRLLQDVPYQTYLDMAAVCEIAIQSEKLNGTALVHHAHLQLWKLTEDTLFQIAWDNTRSDRLPILKPVDYPLIFLEETSIEPGAPQSLHAVLQNWRVRMLNSFNPLFVLTNQQNLHGAACILYPDVLRTLADAMESDLYLIPSSIHEMMISSARDTTISALLTDILQEVNRELVLSTEVLGSHIYHYERLTHLLRCVPDNLPAPISI